MNYLAHLSLSFDDPSLMVGNFVADEIRAKDIDLLSDDIALGVYLHREIDRYTDQHVSYIDAVDRLKRTHLKYAPVIIDIAFDHFLSVMWSEYSDDSLDQFIQHSYRAMTDMHSELMGRALLHVETVLTHRYLHVYGSREGLVGVMGRMDRRTRFPSDFVGAVDMIWDMYQYYQADFGTVYSALKDELPSMLDRARLALEMKRNREGSAK